MVTPMTDSDIQIGTSGAQETPLACSASRYQLNPDETQDERQTIAEVDQPLEQAAQQEVELTQAHQGERVGGEDDEGVLW